MGTVARDLLPRMMRTADEKVCSFIHVDDDLDELCLVQEGARLSGLPFQIEAFFSGDELMGYLRREWKFTGKRGYATPDFILLDYDLKLTTAPAVIAEIRKLPSEGSLPIIVYTNSCNGADALRSYHAGASCFLSKPLKLSRVRLILETLYHCAKTKPTDYRPLVALEECVEVGLEAPGGEGSVQPEV